MFGTTKKDKEIKRLGGLALFRKREGPNSMYLYHIKKKEGTNDLPYVATYHYSLCYPVVFNR